MKKNLLTAALLLAATFGAEAQTNPYNDAGVTVNPNAFSFTPGPVIPTRGGASCPPVGAVTSGFTGTTTQSGRIFRDGTPSACPTKPYPGIFNVGTIYNYETFTYTNTSAAAACVTVNFNPDTAPGTPCTTNAHASAYIGSYDPMNQATNFVGDVGSSLTQPFLFEVPAGQNLVLAVTNTSAQAICNFAFEVVNLPCVAGSPVLGLSATTLDFGRQNTGAFVDRTLTVSNAGTADLSVTAIPAPTVPFTVNGGTCAATPFTLTAGGSCTVIYRFLPTAAGTFTSPVAVTSNGGNLTVTLTGTGVVSIPLNTLSTWSMGLLVALFGLSSLVLLRRRG